MPRVAPSSWDLRSTSDRACRQKYYEGPPHQAAASDAYGQILAVLRVTTLLDFLKGSSQDCRELPHQSCSFSVLMANVVDRDPHDPDHVRVGIE